MRGSLFSRKSTQWPCRIVRASSSAARALPVGERRVEQPVRAERLDDGVAGGAQLLGHVREAPVVHQPLGEVLAAARRVGHGVHLGVALAVGAARARALGVHQLAVGALHLAEPLEALGAGVGLADRALVRRAHELEVEPRLLRLEGHVPLQLLGDPLLQRRGRHLQHLHRLDEPRHHPQLLPGREPL